MYHGRLLAAFFAKRAAQVQHRESLILEWSGTFAEDPREVCRSPDYKGTLPDSSFGSFLAHAVYF